MTRVTFGPDIGGDSITIDDTDDPNTGLANGGHRTRFVLALQQVIKCAVWIKNTALAIIGYRDAAAASASQALTYAGLAQAAAGVPSYAGKANHVMTVNGNATGVAWSNSLALASVAADALLANIQVLRGTQPILRFDETDQAGGVGLFDVKVDMGGFQLLRNTAAARDFSTNVMEYFVTKDGQHLFGSPSWGDVLYKYIFQGDMKIVGALTATNVTANVASPSDITLKTNVEPLRGALATVKRLRGVRHQWKGDSSGRKDVGVIAQELREVLPELVCEGSDGKLSVAYSKLTAVLIEAIKEQDARLCALEKH